MNKLFEEINDGTTNPYATPQVDKSKIESDDLFTRLGEKLSASFLSPLLTMPPMTPGPTPLPASTRTSFSVWTPEETAPVQTAELGQLMSGLQVGK